MLSFMQKEKYAVFDRKRRRKFFKNKDLVPKSNKMEITNEENWNYRSDGARS